MSSGMASLHEMQTVYSLADVYDMLEVARIDGQNRRALTPKEG